VENHPSQLNEIVVTSQRRSENLQTIPLSVTAAIATELLNEGATDTAALSQAVPALSYTLGGNAATPFIRGVGTTVNSVGNEASVATYVDGVYISSINAQLFELYNIDRIEVLKGPQGALFGRNATGGVIQVITKDPSFTPSADLQMGYGNYDTTNSSFYGTIGRRSRSGSLRHKSGQRLGRGSSHRDTDIQEPRSWWSIEAALDSV
jgi:iron complex outermembrane receptor protein